MENLAAPQPDPRHPGVADEPGVVDVFKITHDYSFSARCSCGYVEDFLETKADAIRATVQHLHARHPERVETYLAQEIGPPDEQIDARPVPDEEFIVLMTAMMRGADQPRPKEIPLRPIVTVLRRNSRTTNRVQLVCGHEVLAPLASKNVRCKACARQAAHSR